VLAGDLAGDACESVGVRALATRKASIAAAVIAAVAVLVVVLHALGGSSPREARHGLAASGAGSPVTASASVTAGATDSRAAASAPALLAAARPSGTRVSVAVAAGPAGPVVPAGFLGLSFELRDLAAIAGYANRGNLVALLRSLGPGVLRFGGVSADERAAWVPAGGIARAGTETAIDVHDLEDLGALARETGWRMLLTVDLGDYDPGAAAREAAAARAALGPALAGIEIGNEPDRYVRQGLRARGWSFAAYSAQAAAYRAAIAAAARGVPIAGPDPSSGAPGLAWLGAAARALHLGLLTDHYYPLSSCGYRPSVGELLSWGVRAKDAAMLARVRAIARAAATPLRVDELGSVSCEGFPGVSDTFASALWALDYTARAAAAGVAGLNFHDLLAKRGAYSPLVAPTRGALAAGTLRAQPEWYALLAARELAGARALPTSVAGPARGALDASAFRAPDGRVLLVLVDYDPPGSPPLAVSLRIPRVPGGASDAHATASGDDASARRRGASAYTSGSVLRLTAPSPAATVGVRLAGRAVAPDGSWTAPAALPAVYRRHGAASVQLAPGSAAVVTLYPG
jgi:hypothetical protein